jgi:hypothetical protein
VCISNARSASTESQSDSKKFIDKKGNLDQVEGVHNIEKKPSIEEPRTENIRWVRRICFQEILPIELSKSRKRKVCVGNLNPIKEKA